MKKQILVFALGITSTFVYAGSVSDQLFCKNLQFSQNNYQPNVILDPEFQTIFKQANGGYTLKDEYKYKYEYKDRMSRNKVFIEGLPILWVNTGHQVNTGLDKNKINRIYTRTVISGSLDNVKNILEKSLSFKFNKHIYQDNKKGKYMYYAAQPYNNGTNVVATIEGGAGTNQIHVSCGIYNQNINYLLENSKMFRNVPHQ